MTRSHERAANAVRAAVSPTPPDAVRRRVRSGVVTGALVGLSAAPRAGRAQGWPERPITFVCPWPPGGTADQTMRAQVPAGHKLAARDIAEGEAIRKYDTVIGFARSAIRAGEHVHTHNLRFEAFDRDPAFCQDLRPVAVLPATERASFMGIVRRDGRVATRNYIGILSTVNRSATVSRKVAEHFTEARLVAFPKVDGVVAAIEALLPEADAVTRVPCGAEHLSVGLQCGGSDGFSGISANPALGAAMDLLVRHGGTATRARPPARSPAARA